MKFWKKTLPALVLSAALLAGSASAAGLDGAFPVIREYPGFADVEPGWYYDYVKICYETGLMNGAGGGFNPMGTITVIEVAGLAANLDAAVKEEAIPTPGPGESWYQPFLDRMEALGIALPEDPFVPASRADLVRILSAVIPDGLLEAKNHITFIPDSEDEAVLAFYNAGLLTGTSAYGHFGGEGTLHRCEAAGLMARIVRSELRVSYQPQDYSPFTAAYLTPETVLFTGGAATVTAGDYLPRVVELIQGLEAQCAAQGMEFNWFHTVDGETFLRYVKRSAMEAFGVTEQEGTEAYRQFDVQVFYSRLIDLKGGL